MNEREADKQQEADRIHTLHKYEILDTPPDGSFDHVVQLAASLLAVPIALVTLVDTDRIWFKSAVGLDVPQIGRDPGLCASAILSDELYVVENARVDHRTLANPLVAGAFGLQFYAAVPLKVRGGYNLGTLCIIDREPRVMEPAHKKILEQLGEILIDQLELRLEARQASARQQQMLSMVAHELKNPLTIIPAYTELIEKTQGDWDAVMTMCVQIRKASDRMNGLINEVLETAKMYTTQIPLKKSVFDVASVVNRVTAINGILANAKRQQLKLNIADHVMVEADENKMFDVLNNLVNNAIKYSPAGSSISLLVKSDQESAIFEICDEGPGLTEDDLKQLFLPFTRLSARPTAGEHSTGIGLFIVKTLIEAQDGKVSAHNIDGAGACFLVQMPIFRKSG